MSAVESVHRPDEDARAVPLDPPRASASGPAPYRLLLVGGEVLDGRGVSSHDHGLIGSLARALGRSLGHGVDVEGHVLQEASPARIEQALRRRAVGHLDAVVLLVEPRRADEPAGDLRQTLAAVSKRMAGATALLVAVSPGADADGRGHVAAVRTAAHGIADVIVLEQDEETPLAAAERYAIWAEDLAYPLVSRLMAPRLWAAGSEIVNEQVRLSSVRDAGAAVEGLERSMQRFVDLATEAYGARAAALSLIDGSTTRYIAARHMEYSEQVREASLCATAMQSYGGLLVPDARHDDRFRDYDAVRRGDVTFYAGYRIVSPDGSPIGALCVFDPAARSIDEQDLVVLRDLALAAERELWQLWPDRTGPAPAAALGERAGTA